MAGVDLAGADFTGADFTGAALCVTEPETADFVVANDPDFSPNVKVPTRPARF
ncbi:pentapeptide repeat-containing protein [Lentilitoribacter sp. EG35]|uniref:pentapeptide repeat-containing protein n=1 Tax=Lentilitoribacter sp. EG35 TaxID=3234192 RepID=UPI0034601D8B